VVKHLRESSKKEAGNRGGQERFEMDHERKRKERENQEGS